MDCGPQVYERGVSNTQNLIPGFGNSAGYLTMQSWSWGEHDDNGTGGVHC